MSGRCHFGRNGSRSLLSLLVRPLSTRPRIRGAPKAQLAALATAHTWSVEDRLARVDYAASRICQRGGTDQVRGRPGYRRAGNQPGHHDRLHCRKLSRTASFGVAVRISVYLCFFIKKAIPAFLHPFPAVPNTFRSGQTQGYKG